MELLVVRQLAILTTARVLAFPPVLHITGVPLVSASVVEANDTTLELLNLLSSIIDGEIEEFNTFSQPFAHTLISLEVVCMD